MLRHLPVALLACGAFALPSAAQARTEAAPLPDGAPPHLALIDRDGLKRHVLWLADDARRGRYTGSEGQRETVDYVASAFRRLGLSPLGDGRSFVQTYPLRSVAIGKGTRLSFGPHRIDRAFALLPSADDDQVSLRGRFAWCGNGTGELPDSLQRRIPLVVLSGLRKSGGAGSDLRAVNRYRSLAQKLANKGAAAAVVCLLSDSSSEANALTYRALLADHPQHRYGNGKARPIVRIPLFVIGREESLPLLEHIGLSLDDRGRPEGEPRNEKATGKLRIEVTHTDEGKASNVVAVLRGSGRNRNEAVVFSAHHDHIGYRLDGDPFNGADDNASGTSALLEIAEAFARGGKRPSRSILFLSVSGEELGLWGSAWFADHPTWPLARLIADINIDMIGRAKDDGDTIAMQVTPSHAHREYSTMVRDAVRLGSAFGITFSSGDTYYQRSDHFNFARKGIPVVFFCDGEHPDYHQVGDHADKLDYGHMEAIARLAFWTGWSVSEAKGRPRRLGRQDDW